MAINFPTSLDALTNPTSTDLMENAVAALDHDVQHSNANDAIEALEAKVGINSSAVTTSHDYKLSAVTSTAKALTSGTSTQSVTGLTLVSPTLTLTSDATGDMYYRNSGGLFTRLPIGTTLQILNVDASGIPAWVANPSATPASQTAAGVIEIATTAEQTTGTDDTRAATPKSVHDMTSLAGATWFLDEDTMVSDSATKTASQQSIKAYVDSSSSGQYFTGAGNATTGKTFWNYSIPFISGTSALWTGGNVASVVSYVNFIDIATLTSSNVDMSYTAIVYGSLNTQIQFSGSKNIVAEFFAQCNSVGTDDMSWGLADSGGFVKPYDDATVDGALFTVDATTSKLYAHTTNGAGTTNHTETEITGITLTNENRYRIEFDPGVDVKFYVNGVLKATHTTHLPNSGSVFVGVGTDYVAGSITDRVRYFTAPMISVEK